MRRFEVVTGARIQALVWIILGHVALAYLILTMQYNLLLLSLAINYIISQIGISLTFHRCLAHRSVALPPWLEAVGSVVGGFALQGSPLGWVIVHRAHHKHSGSDRDPHSPKQLGSGYIHMFGYVFSKFNPRYATNMLNTWHVKFDRHYYKIYGTILISSLFLLPVPIALAIFWAPIAIVFQFENFVNTWLHSWNKDEPVNDQRVQLFVLGEAYHKNHHDRPGEARFGKYDFIGFIAEKLK